MYYLLWSWWNQFAIDPNPKCNENRCVPVNVAMHYLKWYVSYIWFHTGSEQDVTAQEKRLYDIALNNGGIPAGDANGERGYMLTFVIAYIRVSSF